MIGSLLNHPLRQVQRMKARHEKEMRTLLKDLQKEKEEKIQADENFLRSPNVNATEQEIEYYKNETETVYKNAFEFLGQ